MANGTAKDSLYWLSNYHAAPIILFLPLWQRACPELVEGGTKGDLKSLSISLHKREKHGL